MCGRFLAEPYPKRLSEWHLFRSTRDGLRPNAGVVPYDLNTPLFSDYASKHRFVWMPAGAAAEYRDDGPLEFPVGTIFSKTFAFPKEGGRGGERLIETRLLVHTAGGWVPLPYIWNQEEDEAFLRLVPDPVEIHFSDAAGRRIAILVIRFRIRMNVMSAMTTIKCFCRLGLRRGI